MGEMKNGDEVKRESRAWNEKWWRDEGMREDEEKMMSIGKDMGVW